MKQTVISTIVRVLGRFSVVFDEAVVAELEKKVLASNPEKPLNYAYICARNWALDQIRNRASKAKEKSAALMKAEEKRQAREKLERCQQEFDSIVFKLILKLKPKYLTAAKQLEIVRISCFVGLKDADCAKIFSGTTRNQRYAWKRRGALLVVPHASAELKEALTKSWRQ